jgi:ABC-type sulfate/molybdate transport systems ATPase subunit
LPYCYHQNCSAEEARGQVAEILGLIELSRLAHNTPGNIHANLRQRIALGRSLILNPEILLLDNPLRGMDPRERRWWLEFLGKLHAGSLKNRKVTLVVSADDFGPWRDQADKFSLIKENHLMPLGDRSELSRHHEPLLLEMLSHGFPGN